MIFDHENVLLLLDSEFHNGINDRLSRKQLEECLPGAICNEELNTPDVIYSKLLRFEYNGFIYEYGPRATQLTVIRKQTVEYSPDVIEYKGSNMDIVYQQ